MPINEPQRGLPIALSIVCLAVGCSTQHLTPTEEFRPVKTMVVAAGDRPTLRSFPGRVEASKMVDLAFQVSGVLVKLPFREGERASRGATIAQLRQDEFQARLQAVQGQLDQARAQLGVAETRLANAKTKRNASDGWSSRAPSRVLILISLKPLTAAPRKMTTPSRRRFAVSKAASLKQSSSSGTALCALRTMASSPSGWSMRARTSWPTVR